MVLSGKKEGKELRKGHLSYYSLKQASNKPIARSQAKSNNGDVKINGFDVKSNRLGLGLNKRDKNSASVRNHIIYII